jgi:hypothetical protein
MIELLSSSLISLNLIVEHGTLARIVPRRALITKNCDKNHKNQGDSVAQLYGAYIWIQRSC